jgi:hypothetical protein
MTLYEKIIKIYPELTEKDFAFSTGTIQLQNDGNGDFIRSWENSNLKPTDKQLAAIVE